MKKKFCIIMILTVVLAVVFSFGAISGYIHSIPVSVDYGYSELYYEYEMYPAIEIIKDKVNSMHGCKLYSLSYKGDIYSMQELEYCNRLNQDGEPYTECIVFGSCFRTPIWGGEGFSSNTLEYWSWYLARTENGTWQLVAWGYP